MKYAVKLLLCQLYFVIAANGSASVSLHIFIRVINNIKRSITVPDDNAT